MKKLISIVLLCCFSLCFLCACSSNEKGLDRYHWGQSVAEVKKLSKDLDLVSENEIELVFDASSLDSPFSEKCVEKGLVPYLYLVFENDSLNSMMLKHERPEGNKNSITLYRELEEKYTDVFYMDDGEEYAQYIYYKDNTQIEASRSGNFDDGADFTIFFYEKRIGEKPSDVESIIYEYAQEALTLVDEYRSNHIDYKDTYDKLNSLSKKIESICDNNNLSYDNSRIGFNIFDAAYEIYQQGRGNHFMIDVLYARNVLALSINEMPIAPR